MINRSGYYPLVSGSEHYESELHESRHSDGGAFYRVSFDGWATGGGHSSNPVHNYGESCYASDWDYTYGDYHDWGNSYEYHDSYNDSSNSASYDYNAGWNWNNDGEKSSSLTNHVTGYSDYSSGSSYNNYYAYNYNCGYGCDYNYTDSDGSSCSYSCTYLDYDDMVDYTGWGSRGGQTSSPFSVHWSPFSGSINDGSECGYGCGCGGEDDYSYRSADFYAPNFSVTMTETTYDGEYYESNEVWHPGRGSYYYYGYLYSGSAPSSHSPGGSAPNAPSSYGSITVAGIPLNYNGNPNFNNYTYVDPEAILDEKYPKPPEPTLPEPAEPPVTPVLPTAPAQPQNSWSDWLNNGINNFFFNTTINPDNENFKQIREQNDIANQVAGTAVHPDRGTWEDAKNLAGTVSGAGAFINGLEQATNTDNSTFDRLMGGISAGLSVTGAIGTVAAAEGRMCGLVSCFTAGTQVVTGENTIESACGTEIVVGQSFDSSNIVFVGLGIGVTSVFLSLLRKERERNELKDKRKYQENQNMNEFENTSKNEVIDSNAELKTAACFSWRKWFLLPLLFVLIILCGYFALPTTKSVAVSTGTASIEKRYVTKNIEDIQVGDEVLATDSETGKVVKCKVTQVFVNNTTGIHLVSVVSVDHSQQTFNVTESHPYFVIPDDTETSWNTVLNRAVVFTDTPEDEPESSFIISDKHGNKYLGCYVAARDLQVGDKLIGPSGELSQVISNIFELHPEGITTYNFEVEHAHNYFVLAQHDLCTDIPPVLVHNMCDVKKGSKLATGGGKNAQHGRAKPLTTVEQQIAKLKKQAETSPRRERNQIQTKINNLEKKLAERKRGENHSQRPKGGSR